MSKGSGVAGKTMLQLARAIAATKRKEIHAARSPKEQLALLKNRPGQSLREREKLTLATMQTPEAKAGVAAAFNATPQELGDAAVKAPRRRSHRGRRVKKPDTNE